MCVGIGAGCDSEKGSRYMSVAVITGAAGELGAACARQFVDHHLVMVDLKRDELEMRAQPLQALGHKTTCMTVDITKQDDCLRFAALVEDLGGFDVLVHTAGVAPPAPPETIYAVNLYGTANLLNAFERLVRPGTVGVCLASIAGHRRLTYQFDSLLLAPDMTPLTLASTIEKRAPSIAKTRLAYAASKRGTILQVQSRASRWTMAGGRLLSVSPSVIGDTTMGANRQAAIKQGGDVSITRSGTSVEIAAIVQFAASRKASFMSGSDLLADGGFLAEINYYFDPARRDSWHALEL
jgi:NAD(P)-dependent dehydrogenase (short-subunit alcohol dehydrogenase family)